mmetsp:Transcript_57/g.198  ORF Transcript_57/g.198 Transcript_57/m.198 type:complete len:83 (-) Transcript_57:77-325(-)
MRRMFTKCRYFVEKRDESGEFAAEHASSTMTQHSGVLLLRRLEMHEQVCGMTRVKKQCNSRTTELHFVTCILQFSLHSKLTN